MHIPPRPSPWRRWSATGAATLTLAGLSIAAVASADAAEAAPGCRVDYAVGSQWTGGFTGNVTVTNLGDTLNGWNLAWTFAAGQKVTQGWNAVVTQNGDRVTATNASWNAALAPNGSVSFGFNATSADATNPAPVAFTLNGAVCGPAGPTLPSTSAPGPVPPSTPSASVTPSSTAPSPSAGPRATFTNPIKRGGPDPWLQYHDGFYYLATTTWNSTITMRRSATLAGLAGASDQVVFNLAGRPNGCCNMWAPEFHLLDGPNGRRWYMYYVAGRNVPDFNPTQRLHVLESAGTDPMGPYTFKADLGNDWQLDASVLTVGGRLYLMGTYGGDGAGQSNFIQRLSNPWTVTGNRVRLSSPTLSWERQTAPVNEGPEPLYHNGRVMVVYSASACWGPDYKLGLLTLTGADPMNPGHWTKHPRPVFQRDDANGVYAPGHNGFFKSPDGTEDWVVYHANSSARGGCDMNRSTRAQKLTWNADGTPNFGTPVRLGATLTAPSGERVQR